MIAKTELVKIIQKYLELDVFDLDAPTGKSNTLERLERRARRAIKTKEK
jgi:hypothetical protein